MRTDRSFGHSVTSPASARGQVISMADPLAFEQKLAFLREPPAFPAWLLIFLYAGVGALRGGAGGWVWIGCAAAIALARVLTAIQALAPQRSAQAVSGLAI